MRVLGNLLNVAGFDYDSSEAVRDEVLSGKSVADRLNNHIAGVALQAVTGANSQGIQRVSDVPIYSADAVVRRAAALQMTRDAAAPTVAMHSSELRKLGVKPGDTVRVNQGNAGTRLKVRADDGMPVATARVAAGHQDTAALGAMFGAITVEPVIGDSA
ncbi:MAG: hypothetical protein ACHP79_08945 [Terriglobales bacterium]